jgi:hypothetical protein
MTEMLAQTGIDQLPHPGQSLMLALGGEFAGRRQGLRYFSMASQNSGDAFLVQALAAVITGGDQLGDTGRSMCSALRHWARVTAVAAPVDIGLVDDHQIGDLDDALLDRLQVVAGIRQLQQAENVDHAGHRRFRLADADRLDDDHVEAGRFAEQHGFARLFGDAAERTRPTGWAG